MIVRGLENAKNFSNEASHLKMVQYVKQGKARKGPDFNPSRPLDPELVMISGGRRSHGSLAIDNGLIRCSSTLPQIKKRQTSGNRIPGLLYGLSSLSSITLCLRPSMITMLTSGVAGCY